MSTFDNLVKDLTRDVQRVQPKDALQFCASWFQSRLEEQRARTRDVLANRRSLAGDLPTDFYTDTTLSGSTEPASSTHFFRSSAQYRSSQRNSVAQSPFGMLNVPGNALLPDDVPTSPFNFDRHEVPPTSPLTISPAFSFDATTPTSNNPGDYLHPPTSAIFARRTSVSAESIAVDSTSDEPLPTYPKTDDQIRRIRASMAGNFNFRDLDEEQETGVLNAMREVHVDRNRVVIRQGDVGELFYVVEAGLLHCYIRPEPLPPTWLTQSSSAMVLNPEDMFIQPGYHPEFGKQVAECKPGTSFGDLALMYGHPRAATVLTIEPSTLWSLDRITYRTIILKAAHRRRTMYEQFLSSVTLLSSLDAQERSKIADALVSNVYLDGEAVVRQGEMGDTFFFIEEGEATVTKAHRDDNGDVQEIAAGRLTKGDYFGELSLLRRAPRAATVSAIYRDQPTLPKLKVAALDAPAFTRLLGPLREIMERKAGERYGRMSR